MVVLILGECLRGKVSTVFEKGLKDIYCNDFFCLKVGNAFQRNVKGGYRTIIYRVIRNSEWGVCALGNKGNISREL